MPTIRKRRDSWHLYWYGPDRNAAGKLQEHSASLGPVAQSVAQQALRLKTEELRRAKLSNVVQFPQGRVPSFAEFAPEYLHWHSREFPDSRDRIKGIVEQHLVPFFGATALDRLSKTQAERYKTSRKAKAETIAKELRTLQAMLNRAVFLEILARNPVKGVKPPRNVDSKPPRWYSAAELERIYRHSKPLAGDEAKKGKPINSPVADYAPIWRLLANTGLRRTEAQQLTWRDVSADHLRVLSSEGSRTKSRKWRQVPLSPGALEALKALRPRRAQSDRKVLPAIEPHSLSRAFERSATRAGLDGTLHCLRHTFCAQLVTAGVPLRTVQVLAGHASFSTTERYAHLAPDYLADSVARLKL